MKLIIFDVAGDNELSDKYAKNIDISIDTKAILYADIARLIPFVANWVSAYF